MRYKQKKLLHILSCISKTEQDVKENSKRVEFRRVLTMHLRKWKITMFFKKTKNEKVIKKIYKKVSTVFNSWGKKVKSVFF